MKRSHQKSKRLTLTQRNHCRGEDEIVYQDMPEFDQHRASTSSKKASSAAKVQGACQAVRRWSERSKGDAGQRETNHLWLDNVCIDKRDPFELSASINSMYKWYRQAAMCFAYLSDFQRDDPSSEIAQSKWFTRGWTLQELVAPKNVMFFDRDWQYLGDRESLQPILTSRTNISRHFLLHSDDIRRASISQRMSWFSGRQTTVPEDIAYCLLGLFDVSMPLLYGEGAERAFRRLQEEIMRYSDDHSLFAWKIPTTKGSPSPSPCGLLAGSPLYFQDTGGYEHMASENTDQPFQMTNKGIYIQLYIQERKDCYVASFDCPHGNSYYLGMYLKRHEQGTDRYYRVQTDRLCLVDINGRGNPKRIYVKAPDQA